MVNPSENTSSSLPKYSAHSAGHPSMAGQLDKFSERRQKQRSLFGGPGWESSSRDAASSLVRPQATKPGMDVGHPYAQTRCGGATGSSMPFTSSCTSAISSSAGDNSEERRGTAAQLAPPLQLPPLSESLLRLKERKDASGLPCFLLQSLGIDGIMSLQQAAQAAERGGGGGGMESYSNAYTMGLVGDKRKR